MSYLQKAMIAKKRPDAANKYKNPGKPCNVKVFRDSETQFNLLFPLYRQI